MTLQEAEEFGKKELDDYAVHCKATWRGVITVTLFFDKWTTYNGKMLTVHQKIRAKSGTMYSLGIDLPYEE